MKIYFCASGRGYDKLGGCYVLISEKLRHLGHILLDNSVGQTKSDIFYSGTEADRLKKYQNALKYIQQADVIILEVSVHSFSMGYILHVALELGKPVIALYRDNNKPLFVNLITNEKLQVIDYTTRNLTDLLEEAISCATEVTGNRFNFYLSPLLSHYLDQIAHLKKIPRAVYLRQLIAADYEAHKDTFRFS